MQSGISLSNIKEMSEVDVLQYLTLLDVVKEIQADAMENKNG
jgi:hypothetical protein